MVLSKAMGLYYCQPGVKVIRAASVTRDFTVRCWEGEGLEANLRTFLPACPRCRVCHRSFIVDSVEEQGLLEVALSPWKNWCFGNCVKPPFCKHSEDGVCVLEGYLLLSWIADLCIVRANLSSRLPLSCTFL